MTLAEIAELVDVEPKWVLNTIAALGLPARYTVALARRLDVARAIHQALEVPVSRAAVDADRALREHARGVSEVRVAPDESDVSIALDMDRLASSFNVRLSALRTMYAPRQRGRPRTVGRDPLRAATEWGIDLTLLVDNLRKSVEQRVRQLDDMARFSNELRRAVAAR